MFSQWLNSHRILKWLAKALIRLRLCAGWSEALLVAHTLLLESHALAQILQVTLNSLLLYTLWVFTIETWSVSIADNCTFHLNLTCRNATNHCARASIPLQHGSRGLQRRYSPLKDIVCKLRYIVANILWRNDQTTSITIKYTPLSYRTGGNRKRSEQSMNVVHKSLETVFSIAICRQLGDKQQSKTLF